MLTETTDKKFKWIYWSMVFLALGVISSPTVVSLFHILIAIPAILVFKDSYKEVKIPKSSWFLIALFGWGLISAFVNLDTLVKPGKAFQELKFYLFGWLFIYPLIYFAKNTSAWRWRRLLQILSFVIIVGFFVGISKAWFGFDPVKWRFGDYHIRSGGFTNYMRYGYASSFLFLLGLSMYFNREKIKNIVSGSKLIWAAVIFCFLAIGTAQTRGAVLGLLVALPFLLYRYRPRIAKGLVGLGFLFGITVVAASFTGVIKNRFINIKDGSNTVRMSQFYSAAMAIKDNPVLGLGPDQFSYNVPRIKKEYDIWAKDYSGHAHNIFLEHGANYGVLGIILLFGFLLVWFIEMVSMKSAFGWAIASYIMAFTAAGQVELLFDNTNSHIMFFIYSLSQAFKLKEKS